jgi:putative transposase
MPKIPQQHSARLKDYDYSQNGAHFITFCVEAQLHLFGTISEEEMILDSAGLMIADFWAKIPEKFPSIELDSWVIMPNHMHAIVSVADGTNRLALNQALDWFKTMTTNTYLREAKSEGWQRFKRRLWEQRFYDKLIRNETSLNRTRNAILLDPARWEEDKYYSEG